jgi:hypothetical protein
VSTSASARGPVARGNLAASARATRALTPAEAAWLVAPACALLLLAAIVVLGPPLGRALFAPPGDWTIWQQFVNARFVQLEPTEHARYAIALLGPLLVCGGALALARRAPRTTIAPALVAASQVALLLFVVACVVAQQRHVYDSSFTNERTAGRMVVVSLPTLVVGVLLALLAAWALQRPGAPAFAQTALQEGRRRRLAAIALATLFSLLWLLTAFNTDGTIELANQSVSDNIAFWSDEAFALLDGHAPLVDFHAQYGHLWAYAAAGGMALFGASLAVYAAIMLAGTAGALAAVLATFRQVAGTWPAALALFLPFTATSFYMAVGPLENRYGPANLFSLFPIRYGGPYVLLWLVVRRVRRRATRPPIALFALAGLVAINNLEFGLAALGASLLALAAAAEDRSPRALARLAGAAVAGVAIAVALVSALTLVVAGSLPHPAMLTTFPRIYGAEGFGLLPMPPLGFHLVVYVTFAAAIVVAVVRLATRAGAAADEAPLTTALAWAGSFGLGAGGYFVGRSHPHVLIDLFSAWALALSLLAIVIARALARRAGRRPQLAELLVLAGVGVMACSLAQTPTPWSQVERLWDARPPQDRIATVGTEVVDKLTTRGEPVALMMMLGHRIAYELGLDNVTPYANMDSMMTREQWGETLRRLQRSGGRKVIVMRHWLFPERIEYLRSAGFVGAREAAGVGFVEYVRRGP